MGNNSALTAMAVAESIIPQLQGGTRVQLQRNTLLSLEKTIAQVLSSLQSAELKDDIVLGSFIAALQIIKGFLSDSNVMETDTMTKNALLDKLVPAIDRLYVKVGEYYTKYDFNYSPRMQNLLNRIVDRCVSAGMYFGVDKEE